MRGHFVHGWAFGASIWRPLAARLPELSATYADRGYFGGQDEPAPQEPAVWVTHSLGTLLTLKDMPHQCQALVAISGFDRFCAGVDVAGVVPRVIDRMLGRFDDEPHQVVTTFREQCGWHERIGPIARESLRADLVSLREMDCRSQAAALAIPVLSLHGDNDPILPDALRRQSLHGIPHAKHVQHPAAGHLLPFEDPDWCAAQISAFLGGAR